MFDDNNLALDREMPVEATPNPLIQLAMDGPVELKAKMSRERFHAFLLQNGDVKMERDKFGNITIYPPMTLDSAFNEGEAFFYLKLWSKSNKLGKVYSLSGAFDLPDGSTAKADAAWISNENLANLTNEQRRSIAPIVPDFVIETRSKTDALGKLKKKMTEVWIANGVRLAWLIDPEREKAWIFRADGSVEAVENFDCELSGEAVLEGFSLDLRELKNEAAA